MLQTPLQSCTLGCRPHESPVFCFAIHPDSPLLYITDPWLLYSIMHTSWLSCTLFYRPPESPVLYFIDPLTLLYSMLQIPWLSCNVCCNHLTLLYSMFQTPWLYWTLCCRPSDSAVLCVADHLTVLSYRPLTLLYSMLQTPLLSCTLCCRPPDSPAVFPGWSDLMNTSRISYLVGQEGPKTVFIGPV